MQLNSVQIHEIASAIRSDVKGYVSAHADEFGAYLEDTTRNRKEERMKIPLKPDSIHGERTSTSKVFPKYKFDNGSRTDKQDTDEEGRRLYSVNIIAVTSDESEELETRIVIHSEAEPSLPTGRHAEFDLVEPWVVLWPKITKSDNPHGTERVIASSLHCLGVTPRNSSASKPSK